MAASAARMEVRFMELQDMARTTSPPMIIRCTAAAQRCLQNDARQEPPSPGVRLECPFRNVLPLQHAAGSGLAGGPSLLALADAAPWQVSDRAARTAGKGAD